MRSYIGVVILIGSLCLVFGELLDMPHYWMMVIERRFKRCLVRGNRLAE
ncbi:hypothetical protein Gotur_033604 [Gossypium turneri]